jgi:ectoine hydroxylase-related dioxygenase (phytanoyl-CoA dioxygenase family)
MTGTKIDLLPNEANAQTQECITDEQAKFFQDNGFLVVRQVLVGEELATIQQAMGQLYRKGVAGVENDPDFMYGLGVKSGKQVLRRIEYVIDKSDPMKVLLGHPFILRSVEKLQGRNFIPTWDSMVVKVPDEGVIVPWHRDAAIMEGCTDTRPIFNVDFYLDPSNLKSCLWVIPGSNLWSAEQISERCARPGFDTSDAVPVPLEAGDVIFHNIQLAHGSPSGDGNALRRTVYYEFRPAEVELEFGPHTPEYIPLKQQVLVECIKRRARTSYAAAEQPFKYAPTGEFSLAEPLAEPPTFRYPHAEFRR